MKNYEKENEAVKNFENFLFNIEIPLTTEKNFLLIFFTFYVIAKHQKKNLY